MQAPTSKLLANTESGRGTWPRMTVNRGRLVADEITDFFRHLVEETIESKATTASALAEKGGIGDTPISDLRNEKRGVGWQTLLGLMNAFDMTWQQLDQALLRWRRGTRPATTCLAPSGSTPNQSAAFDFARTCGLSEGAIAYASRANLLANTDPPALAWFDRVRQFQTQIDDGFIPAEPQPEDANVKPPGVLANLRPKKR